MEIENKIRNKDLDSNSSRISESDYQNEIQKLKARMSHIEDHNARALAKNFEILTSSKYRYLEKCIIMFEKEIGEIVSSFTFCLVQKNYFVLQILNRTFIEVLFRYLYIALSFLKTSTDNEARDYTEILGLSETYTMIKKFKNVLKHIGKLENDSDPYEIISERKITKREIREVSSRYSFTNIILELNKYYTDFFSEDTSSPLIKYIIKYSLQSSFMHGGPNAQLRHLFENEDYVGMLENYKFILNCMQLVHLYIYYCCKKIDGSIADEDIKIEIEAIE